MQEIVLKNNQSEVFTLTKYPDGQHTIKLDFNKLNVKDPIVIKCRIRNFGEFEILGLLIAALIKYDFMIKQIQYKYLFGLRSDRAFNLGEPNYRNVLIPIINTFHRDNVLYFPHGNLWAPHQDVSFEMEWQWEFRDFLPSHEDYIYIGGDISAQKLFKLKHGFAKERRISGIRVSLDADDPKNDFSKDPRPIMIMDDLCDAGGTFVAEAEYLKARYPDKKLNLFVVHGLFTQGVHHLLDHFDTIYCTNSYQDMDNPRIKQLKVI